MNTVDLGKVRGNMIYTGGDVKGSSATGIIFRDTGIEKAYEGDIYINLDASGTDNGNVYECVESGESEYAKWAFKGNIRGPKMSAVNHLKSTSTEDALAAFQGKRIFDIMIDAGVFSKHVIVECDQVAYGIKMTIDNVDSAFTFTVDGQKYTYNYAASGTVEKTTLSVVLGENIGMSKSGGVVSAIESTVAYIYDFRLTDSSAMDMYTKNVDLWESLNEVIRNHEVTGSVIDGEETVAMGPIHKFINGAKKMFYPITHAKAVWYDKANKKTVYDVIDEQNKNFKNSDVEYISGGVTINAGSVKRCGKLISVSVDFTTGSGTIEYSQILKNLPKCATLKIIGVINDYKYDTQSGTFMLYNDSKSAILRINNGLAANTKYHLGFVYLTSDSL